MQDEEEGGSGRMSLADYASFGDFLDSYVGTIDKAFLQDVHLSRTIVELGYRGPREGTTKAKFDASRKRIEDRKKAAQITVRTVLSAGYTYQESHIRALQQREEANRTGKQASIIYIRMYAENGQEIAAYIDYAHRLATEDFRPIFKKEVLLMPEETDLIFFNWDTTHRKGSNTPNYELVLFQFASAFRNRRDGKLIYIDPKAPVTGENSCRTVVETEVYISMIIFDHYNRRRV